MRSIMRIKVPNEVYIEMEIISAITSISSFSYYYSYLNTFYSNQD